MNGFFDAARLSNYMDNQLSVEDRIEANYYRLLGSLSMMCVDYRVAHNMNQTELAKHLGVSQPMVAKYESGDYNFSLKTLNSLCAKMDVYLDLQFKQVSEIVNRNEGLDYEASYRSTLTPDNILSGVPQYADAA